MDGKAVTYGFFVYLLSTIVASFFVAPYLSAPLSALFGVLGIWASFVVGAVITFPVFVGFLWLAMRGHVDTTPEL